MMTPSEVREYEFKSSGRNAYNADDVDEFLAAVAADYEKMFRENGELVKRASLLADRYAEVRKDEDDIKQAVLSAQRAADIIVRDAEESSASKKKEAEEVLAAAKGEAEIIKSDAEKQAAADAETLLALTRDKAAEIINKAKEEAGNIISDAKSSAEDKVGAATRTVTSETLYFDMLKKEVADFRAGILAQYKAHIEMISKLPELAEEKAAEQDVTAEEAEREQAVAAVIEDAAADVAEVDAVADIPAEPEEPAEPEITFVTEDEDAGDEPEAEEPEAEEPEAEEPAADVPVDAFASDPFGGDAAPAITFLDSAEAEEADDEPQWNVTAAAAAEEPADEDVVKTELPSEYFTENTTLEFVPDDTPDVEETAETGGFHLDLAGLDFGGADFGEDDEEPAAEEADEDASYDEADDAEPADDEAEDDYDDADEADDVPEEEDDAADEDDEGEYEDDADDEPEDDDDDYRPAPRYASAPPFPKHEFERVETTEPEDNSPHFRFGLFHKKK